MELPTSYNIFWRELRPALQCAGVGLDAYLTAIKRLKVIEGEDKGPGQGQTGYLNGIDPYVAVGEYVRYVCGYSPLPEWIAKAEKG